MNPRLEAAALGELLGLSESTVRQYLIRDVEGFPKPLQHGWRNKWSKAQAYDYIDRHRFRPGTSRQAVDGPVDRLHQLRNRIAHHGPLLRRNTATGVLSLTTQHLTDRLAHLPTVAELISPNLHDYIRATSSVRDKLSDLPRDVFRQA